jgi:hypothetical protein
MSFLPVKLIIKFLGILERQEPVNGVYLLTGSSQVVVTFISKVVLA